MPRPAVAAAVVNNGWDLIELTRLDMSLEDVFLELTTDEEIADAEFEAEDDLQAEEVLDE